MSDRGTVSVTAVQENGKVRPGDETPESDPVVRLLEAWLADDSGYDEDAWPELKDALDRDRLSSRKLFRG